MACLARCPTLVLPLDKNKLLGLVYNNFKEANLGVELKLRIENSHRLENSEHIPVSLKINIYEIKSKLWL